MDKFLLYSTGVFCWLNATIACAAEKFDVLPDLPDPLAYAVQPAEASTISGDGVALGAQSIGHEPSIISVVTSLIFVILLIYVTGIIYARLNRSGFNTIKKQQGDFAKSYVSVLSTTQLGTNKTLHVVELDGKRMLIGASSGAIQLIKDLGSVNNSEEEEEYSHIEIPNIKIPKIEIPKIEIPSISFSKIATKMHKSFETKEETENVVTENNTILENKEEKEKTSSEGIIDSLFEQQEEHLENIEETIEDPSAEHKVDPEDFVLYKKYLG